MTEKAPTTQALDAGISEKERAQALLTLASAENVRSRIMAAFAVGNSRLPNAYYAMKIRVKDLKSLIGKVEKKRIHDKRPEYSLDNVTDHIGLRILTLRTRELSDAVKDLIDFVRLGQNPDMRIFWGLTPVEAIHECIVYESERHVGEEYKDVHNYFENIGVPAEARRDMQRATKERPYSSIHIILRCVPRVGDLSKPVYVEAQIRTVYEDIWGEVDHKIRYKGYRSDDTDGDDKLRVHEMEVRLRGLKKRLADAGEEAHEILMLEQQLTEERTLRESMKLPFTPKVPSHTLRKELRVDPKDFTKNKAYADEFDDIAIRTNVLLSREERLPKESESDFRQAESLIERLSSLMSRHEYYDKADEENKLIIEFDPDFYFLIQMQKVNLYLLIARARRRGNGLNITESEKAVEKAKIICNKMRDNKKFSNDAYVRYRLNSCLRLQKHYDQAAQEIDIAYRLLNTDPKLEGAHAIRGHISTRYAITCWNEFRNLRNAFDLKSGVVEHREVRLQMIEILRASLTATIDAYCSFGKSSADDDSKTHLKALSVAGIASYCFALYEIGDTDYYKFALREKDIYFKTCAQLMESVLVSNREVNRADLLESLLQLYVLLEDKESSRKTSDRLSSELNKYTNDSDDTTPVREIQLTIDKVRNWVDN